MLFHNLSSESEHFALLDMTIRVTLTIQPVSIKKNENSGIYFQMYTLGSYQNNF